MLPLFALAAADERIAYWDRVFEYAYPAYLVAFALGALLMLVAVFMRGRRRYSTARDGGPPVAITGVLGTRAILFHVGLIILLILCALSNQTTIDRNRGFIADQEKRYEKMMADLEHRTDREEVLRAQYLYMPVGNSLAYMTAGNTGIAADYLWLTSMQYVSTSFRRGHKFEMLSRFYTTMLEMDPHWVDAHVNAGKVLSALEPNRYAVENFYIQAIVKNPDDWHLPEQAARLFVVPPMNLDEQAQYAQRAVGWFKTAMARKTFPKDKIQATTNLMALMSAEAGYYEAADKMLFQQATDESGNINLREIAARDWMNVHSIRLAKDLENFSTMYKQQRGTYAPNLEVLLNPLPPDDAAEFKEDAFGYPFDYDPATGKVESRGVNTRKAMTISHMLDTLIELYRGDHQGNPPKTVAELRIWVQRYYGPNNPPNHAMQEALGADLNVEHSPLGTWDYDPETGKITLPPWCNATQLYKKSDDVLELGKKKRSKS